MYRAEGTAQAKVLGLEKAQRVLEKTPASPGGLGLVLDGGGGLGIGFQISRARPCAPEHSGHQ